MFLTDNEMRTVREAVEAQAGFDMELIKACSHLIHIQAFDEAVRNAFVLLEDRMRKVLNKQGMTGCNMAQYAFSTNGPFTKMLSHNQHEYEGTRDLFFGAFRLYRNPSAHTIVGYEAGEARSIISLINLLLRRLDQLADIPQPGVFQPNIESALSILEQQIGTQAVTRIRVFLGQCIKLQLQPRGDAKQWIPFRKHALVKNNPEKPPKPHLVTLFYLTVNTKEQGLWFPVNQYYSNIIGIDKPKIHQGLQELGFQLIGQVQDPYISINTNNSQPFFDKLYVLISQISKDFENTLKIKN